MGLISAGVGICAEDKNDGSPFISVFLKEAHPFHEGEIGGEAVKVTKEGVDGSGKPYSVVLHKTTAVKARWKKSGNRINAPNIRKGEEVDVFELEGTSVYYWEERQSAGLRRAESVTFAVNASGASTSANEEVTADNAYTISVDGKTGAITLRTSQANGEKVRFTVQFNGREGHCTLTDGTRTVQMDADTDSAMVQNSKSFLQLIGGKGRIGATESLTLEVPEATVLNNLTVDGELKVAKQITCPLFIGNVRGTFVS